MHPYLVCSPRLQNNFKQRILFRGFDYLIMGNGMFSVLPYLSTQTAGALPFNRKVNGSLGLLKAPLNHSHIDLSEIF